MDECKPWDIQPNEPSELFKRFRRYLTLPGKRSLLAAYNSERLEKGQKRSTGYPDTWQKVFHDWKWQERAEACDKHELAIELEEWKQKRRALRHQQWEDAQLGISKAKEMLRLPIVERVSADGQTVIKPGKWTFQTAIAMLSESYRLAREAAQVTTTSEEEALQVLADLGVLTPEIVTVGTDALRQATQSILEAIARGSESEKSGNNR